jgi:hypothetical protein
MQDCKRPKATTFVHAGNRRADCNKDFSNDRGAAGMAPCLRMPREFAGQRCVPHDIIAGRHFLEALRMKRMRNWVVLCASLLMIASAKPVFAAIDVTGTWTGNLNAPDGSTFPLSFTFKQDGTKVTGTVLGPQGDPLPIANGKIDGDKFTFDTSFNGMTISHVCTLNGDEMKVSTKTDNDQVPPMEFTLKRSAAAAPDTPKSDAPAPK